METTNQGLRALLKFSPLVEPTKPIQQTKPTFTGYLREEKQLKFEKAQEDFEEAQKQFEEDKKVFEITTQLYLIEEMGDYIPLQVISTEVAMKGSPEERFKELFEPSEYSIILKHESGDLYSAEHEENLSNPIPVRLVKESIDPKTSEKTIVVEFIPPHTHTGGKSRKSKSRRGKNNIKRKTRKALRIAEKGLTNIGSKVRTMTMKAMPTVKSGLMNLKNMTMSSLKKHHHHYSKGKCTVCGTKK